MNEYFETCDFCEKDEFSINEGEITIETDISLPINNQITFLCKKCKTHLIKFGYII